jgi:CelD/BcsL family acetyltransferase involved in cellulose biosynthesis
MATELYHGESVFDALAAEWDDLAARSMTNTPFQQLAYQRAWWQHLRPDGATLHTVALRDQDRVLSGLACFFLLDEVLYFNGCVEETDYLDVICPAEPAPALWQAVLDRLCSRDFPEWKAFDLCTVPEASVTRNLFPDLIRQNGFDFHEEIHEVCPVIQLPATFEEYLESLDSKQRREVQRKLRRAEAADARLLIIGRDDDLEVAVDHFLDLLQKSTFEKRDWLNEGRRALFHETARAALDSDMLQLAFMEVEGTKAAALFNFDYNGHIWVYNSGLDPAAYGALSLGVVLTTKTIEKAIADGRTTFDFLRGSQEYKYRFGAKETHVYRLQARRP